MTFPAGIDTGQRLHVPGQGMPGAVGGPAGDLFVDIEIAPDERFERDGLDLITRANISFGEACLGGTKLIELPDETTVEVEVPSGSQPGDVLSLKGKGAPRVDGRGRGSLRIVVQVDVPKRISPRAIELLAELERELRGAAEKAKAG